MFLSHEYGQGRTDYVYRQLSSEPHYGLNIKKLRNYHPDTWRHRIVKYRLFFEINEEQKTAFITAADFRKDAH